MTDCRVFRRAADGYWVLATGQADTGRRPRTWVAVCPHCGDTIRSRVGVYDSRPTRKTTKDALHLHVKTKHKN